MWFLAAWLSGMLFAIKGIIAFVSHTRVVRVVSYDDTLSFLLEIIVLQCVIYTGIQDIRSMRLNHFSAHRITCAEFWII